MQAVATIRMNAHLLSCRKDGKLSIDFELSFQVNPMAAGPRSPGANTFLAKSKLNYNLAPP